MLVLCLHDPDDDLLHACCMMFIQSNLRTTAKFGTHVLTFVESLTLFRSFLPPKYNIKFIKIIIQT